MALRTESVKNSKDIICSPSPKNIGKNIEKTSITDTSFRANVD